MEGGIGSFVDKLESARDLHDVYSAVGQTIREWCFTRFAYLVMRGLGPEDDFWMANYPQEWSQHYIDRNYVDVDPVHFMARATTLPFRWNDLIARLPPGHQLPVYEAGDFGLRNGVTVPLNGPGQCVATFNVTTDLPPGDAEALWRRRQFDLHLMGLHAHENIIARIYSSPEARLVVLYPREKECLLWAARGKTSWEIGNILHLSDQTVTSYLKTAARKLGVYSKTHAVVKAVILGLIHP